MGYAKVALGLPIDKLFDYLIPDALAARCLAGSRVLVPFAKRDLIGYVAGLSNKTNIGRVKPIAKLIDSNPILSPEFLRLTESVADYYCSFWGEVIQAALPAGIKRGLPVTVSHTDRPLSPKGAFKATLVRYDNFETLFEFYLSELEKTIADKKSAIILCSEIKSAQRIADLLKEKFHDGICFSCRKQRVKEELAIWEEARNGKLRILVGTRPAVFAPFSNLGLLIVHDEDAYGHKEEQAPYYHARDVALMRAQLERIPLILTSKTPTLESYYAAKRKKYDLINLGQQEYIKQPKITIVDMKQYAFLKNKAGNILSVVLQDRINTALKAGKKVIIFINKKGFSRYAFCQKCGYLLVCDKCSRRLVYRFEDKKLVCNSCGAKKELASFCPACKSEHIKYAGAGIEKVISQLSLCFPQAKINRIDREHTVSSLEAQMIVATEMIFHQEYIPKASIVAVLDLDSALNIVNFRSNEKIYSLLYRLKGLAADELLIQTRIADYYFSKKINKLNLDGLYDAELKERKALGLAPFLHLANLNLRGRNLERLRSWALKLYEKLKEAGKKVSVFAPVESVPFKVRGNFRFQILLKAKNALDISRFIKKRLKEMRSSGIIVTVDVDPQ